MLRVLCGHADDVVRAARTEAARVCQLWLESMPPRWDDAHAFPLRRKAAELAVAIAREVQGLLAEGEHFSDREEHPEFRRCSQPLPIYLTKCLNLPYNSPTVTSHHPPSSRRGSIPAGKKRRDESGMRTTPAAGSLFVRASVRCFTLANYCHHGLTGHDHVSPTHFGMRCFHRTPYYRYCDAERRWLTSFSLQYALTRQNVRTAPAIATRST